MINTMKQIKWGRQCTMTYVNENAKWATWNSQMMLISDKSEINFLQNIKWWVILGFGWDTHCYCYYYYPTTADVFEESWCCWSCHPFPAPCLRSLWSSSLSSGMPNCRDTLSSVHVYHKPYRVLVVLSLRDVNGGVQGAGWVKGR